MFGVSDYAKRVERENALHSKKQAKIAALKKEEKERIGRLEAKKRKVNHARKLRNSGMTYHDIAAKLGCSYTSVYSILKKNLNGNCI